MQRELIYLFICIESFFWVFESHGQSTLLKSKPLSHSMPCETNEVDESEISRMAIYTNWCIDPMNEQFWFFSKNILGYTKLKVGEMGHQYFEWHGPFEIEVLIIGDSVYKCEMNLDFLKSNPTWSNDLNVNQSFAVFGSATLNAITNGDSTFQKIVTSSAARANHNEYFFWPSGMIKEVHRFRRNREIVFLYDQFGQLACRRRIKTGVKLENPIKQTPFFRTK